MYDTGARTPNNDFGQALLWEALRVYVFVSQALIVQALCLQSEPLQALLLLALQALR